MARKAEVAAHFEAHPDDARLPLNVLEQRLGVSKVTIWRVLSKSYPNGKPRERTRKGEKAKRDYAKHAQMVEAFRRNGLPVAEDEQS